MRAVVTGGLGFVGRHLVRAPARGGRRGHHARPPRRPRRRHHGRPRGGRRPGRGRARGRVPPGRLGRRRRVVARPGRRCSASTPRARSTCSGRARRPACERVLAVASADVYGVVTEAELPLTEASPLRPTSPYAASKLAADALAQQAFLGYGLGVVRVRPFNHLGPGQSEQFVAPAIAARIARAERDEAGHHRRGQPLRPARRHRRPRRGAGLPAADRAGRRRRGLQRVHRRGPGRADAGRPARAAWPGDRSSWSPTPPCCAPSTCPCCGATRRSCAPPPAGQPRIPIEQTVADLLDDMRERVRRPRSATPGRRPP